MAMINLGSKEVEQLLRSTGRTNAQLAAELGYSMRSVQMWAESGRMQARVRDRLLALVAEKNAPKLPEIVPAQAPVTLFRGLLSRPRAATNA
jgi:hypothetical protein